MPCSAKTAIVSFHDGPDEYVFVTTGSSVCDAANNALERFDSDWWKGPVPMPETVLYVSQVGQPGRFSVTAEKARSLVSGQLVDDDG